VLQLLERSKAVRKTGQMILTEVKLDQMGQQTELITQCDKTIAGQIKTSSLGQSSQFFDRDRI